MAAVTQLGVGPSGVLTCQSWDQATPFQRKTSKELFDSCDVGKDGTLSTFEFCTLMNGYRPEIPIHDAELLWFLMVPQGAVGMQYKTFCAWLAVMFFDQVEPCNDVDKELGRLLKAAEEASSKFRSQYLLFKRHQVVSDELVNLEVRIWSN